MDANEMSDRMEIRELAFRYARMIDDRDYALADEVFTEDGELIGPGFHLVGGAAIRAALPSIEHFRATLHCVYNQRVELRGDEAEGETYCVANHIHDRSGKAFKLDWGIRYQDRCRRGSKGWRFVRRELVVVWRQDLPLQEKKA